MAGEDKVAQALNALQVEVAGLRGRWDNELAHLAADMAEMKTAVQEALDGQRQFQRVEASVGWLWKLVLLVLTSVVGMALKLVWDAVV